MSVYHKGELIQWVTHESRSSAASNSGLIRIGTQPRTADAWHQWLVPAARRRHPRFFGHFWPSVWPSSRSNFDLGPSPLDSTEKIFRIRAYDFGVQFSFNPWSVVSIVTQYTVTIHLISCKSVSIHQHCMCNCQLIKCWTYRKTDCKTCIRGMTVRLFSVYSVVCGCSEGVGPFLLKRERCYLQTSHATVLIFFNLAFPSASSDGSKKG